MTLMKRSLSSSVTVWWKFVFPTLWITGFGVATVAMWLGAFQSRDNTPTPDWMRWQFLVMWLVASAFLIWFARRLRRVSLCDGRLPEALQGKYTVTLLIPDDYTFMQPELVEELYDKVSQHVVLPPEFSGNM